MLRLTFVSRWPVARIAALATVLPVLTLGMMLATSGVASAHAAYVSSNPAANAVLQQAPSAVTITFAENLTPSSSNIIVYDSKMKQVGTGQAQVDNANLKQMSVPITGDDSDVYVVVWHNVSADDGDPDAGSFSFYIGSDKAPASSTPATSSSSGTPVWLTILVGVLGLVVGGGATYYFVGRNSATK